MQGENRPLEGIYGAFKVRDELNPLESPLTENVSVTFEYDKVIDIEKPSPSLSSDDIDEASVSRPTERRGPNVEERGARIQNKLKNQNSNSIASVDGV